MYRHTSRDRAPKGARIVKLTLLWLVIASVAGGFGASAYVMLTRPPDAVALCESGARLDASTVIVVDTTDSFTEIQRRRARAAIEGARDRLPRGGRLTIVAINPDDASQPLELVSACNPGKPEDANPLFDTTRIVRERWEKNFGDLVEAAIERSSTGPEASSSPIIVTVAALGTRPDFDARVVTRRLIIISDMLEHQKGVYSQLGAKSFLSDYRSSSLVQSAPLLLQGIAVEIDYLLRPHYAAIQGAAHRRFWVRLFGDAGATAVTFIGMPPDQLIEASEEVSEAAMPVRKRKAKKK